jgi:CLIP-associating protein 1/2
MFPGKMQNAKLSVFQAYDNAQSSVRKAAVTCLVTLHALVGDSALQPHIFCLSGPKRKLLSLYIMRHRQKMGASQKQL